MRETGGTGDVYIVKYKSSGSSSDLDTTSKTFLNSTSTVQAGVFSPLGTYFVTWERPSKEVGAGGNLKIFDSESGEQMEGFHMKNPAVPGVSWPAVQWSKVSKRGGFQTKEVA
jgi:uncharacterized protein with WD repeat